MFCLKSTHPKSESQGMFLSLNFRWPLMHPPPPPPPLPRGLSDEGPISAFRALPPPALPPTSRPSGDALGPANSRPLPLPSIGSLKDSQPNLLRPTAHRPADGPPMFPGPLLPPPGLFMQDPLAAKAALLGLHPGALAGLHCSSSKKLFGCPQCRYVTDRKNNLKRHVSTMHQECDKLLECCGVSFKNKAALRDHVLLFHSNGYLCRFCGRNFCRKALLKRHLAVHSGQKDFLCGHCDYATSHKSNLERHKRVHERSPGEEDDEDEIEVGEVHASGFRPFDLINLHPHLMPFPRHHRIPGHATPSSAPSPHASKSPNQNQVLHKQETTDSDSSDLEVDIADSAEVDVVGLVNDN